MPKISVIMPSFNVAAYYKECIESVLNQSFEDIEIIAVDAGSTDGTMDILKSYADADSRIKVINSPQKSYGAQMNIGISAARGEYVGIVETDDALELDAYESLLPFMENYDLDYVKGYAKLFWELGNGGHYETEIANLSHAYSGVICPAERPELLCKDIFIWLGLYKIDFIKKMKFNETAGAAYQDQGFLLQTLGNARRAMYVNVLAYHYRQNNQRASQHSEKGFGYIYNEYELNRKCAEKLGVEWEKAFYARYVTQCLGRCQRMVLTGKSWPSSIEYLSLLQKRVREVYVEKKISYKLLGEVNYALMYLFTHSIENVQSYYREILEEKYLWIRNLLRWATGRRVVIWGCGKWGRFIHALLMLNGVSIESFVDSNSSVWGSHIQGTKVVMPSELYDIFTNYSFIVAVKNGNKEIKEELHSQGVSLECIYWHAIEVDVEAFNASIVK